MLLEPVIYTFVVTFCPGNMNTVREMSGKCQGILKKPVAMNPDYLKLKFYPIQRLPLCQRNILISGLSTTVTHSNCLLKRGLFRYLTLLLLYQREEWWTVDIGLVTPQCDWGLLKPFIFTVKIFLLLRKCLLEPFNHIHIWQVSPQLCLGDICIDRAVVTSTSYERDIYKRYSVLIIIAIRENQRTGRLVSYPHPGMMKLTNIILLLITWQYSLLSIIFSDLRSIKRNTSLNEQMVLCDRAWWGPLFGLLYWSPSH